jgi:hypothetical protein
MANITLNYKGLTGKRGTITAADTATFVSLITLIIADEDPTVGVLTNNDYDIALERDTSITDVANGSDPIAAGAGNLGLVDGDTIICIDDKKNLETTNTKEVRQLRKLRIASVKRLADGKANYTYDATALPDTYNDNAPGADDNPNTGGLIQKRPWVSVGAIAAPASIAESIDGGTLADLQIWYDGSDSVQFQPTGPSDEQLITQWNDKSGTAKNANPSGGNNAKPTFESSDLQNTHEYVKFDGNDNLTINPFNEIDGAAAFTLLIVSTFDTVSGTEYLVDTTTGDFGIFSDAGTMKLTMNGYAATTNKTVSTDAWYIHTFVYTGGGSPALVYRLNKSGATLSVTSGSVPAATGSTTVMTLGNNDGKTAGLTGSIGEVIMFDKVLSSTEYENLENYLETKWDAIP